MIQYLADTNVLLRAANKTATQHPVATRAIAFVLGHGHGVVLAPQTLIEFWSVATRPSEANGFGWPVEQVQREIDRLLSSFLLLANTESVFREWRRLVVQQGVIGKQAHDAHLAAFCRMHGIAHLLTFNTGHFTRYGIDTISPEDIAA